MAIVVPTYNHGALVAEKPEGAVSCKASDTESLGEQIKQKLDECEYRSEFNYSGTKKSDWPAFKVSGQRTIKGFEANFVRYIIQGANEANTVWEILSPVLKDDVRLRVCISASATATEIGERITGIHNFFLKAERIT